MKFELPKASITVAPSFHDTDPMGVVWHGNYLRFFERAREKLFDQIHYSYSQMKASGYIWPVVDVRIKYRRPWLLEELAEVSVEIVEYENRLVTSYKVVRACDGIQLCSAKITQMAFDLNKQAGLLVSPDTLLEKLGVPRP